MHRRSPLRVRGAGVEGLVYTRFTLWFVCLPLPPPNFLSYLGLVLSLSRLRTRMSRSSSVETPGLLLSERPLGIVYENHFVV